MYHFFPISFNAFGVDDSGQNRIINYAFSSVAVVSENGFIKKRIADLCRDIKTELPAAKLGDTTTYDYNYPTYRNIGPYVYLCDNGDLLVDLTYTKDTGRWNDRGVYIPDKSEEILQLLRISPDLGSAEKITDKNSEEWKFIKKQEELLKAERDKTESFIGKHGSVSKDPIEMQKHFKTKYKQFTVPDSEESLSHFFEDSFGNIFNFGSAAVYNEHEKGNIGTRNRSYLNIYSNDGAKKATVRFKGYPVYIFQRDRTYYVVTQQDKNTKTPAKIRLYSFKL